MAGRTKRLLIAAALISTTAPVWSPVANAVADTATPTIALTTNVDSSLAPGQWWVTFEDDTHVQPLTLVSGFIGQAGPLTVAIPQTPLLTTSKVDFVVFHAERTIDSTHAQEMTASIGLSPSMRSVGASYSLDQPVVATVLATVTYPATASSPLPGVCSPPPVGNALPGSCEQFGADGAVDAFRGNAYHILGTATTFAVSYGNTQKWDNGVRYNATTTGDNGSFSINGNTSIEDTSTGGTDTTWPVLGDPQWIDKNTGAQVAPDYCPASQGCQYAGTDTIHEWGKDQWHYSHQANTTCSAVISPLTCTTTYTDYVYDTLNNGGTEQLGDDPSGYYADVAQVKAESYGHWTPFIPGSTQTTTETTATSRTNSSDWNTTYNTGLFSGSINFVSSMTEETTASVKDTIVFRALPWMNAFYRYDNNYDGVVFGHDWYTCEWAAGYDSSPGAYGTPPPCSVLGQ